MKRKKSVLAVVLAASLLVPTMALADEGVSVKRIAGDDRYQTSLKIAEQLGDSSDKVILASGENYPDALAGSVLTEGKYPILLTRANEVSEAVQQKALAAKEVVVLGGTGSISDEVFEKVKDDDTTANRIAGDNRYETAVKIAETSASAARVLVSGEDYPDAVIGASYSIVKNAPILLTTKALQKDTLDALTAKKATDLTIIGGTSSVSAETETEVKALAATVKRFEGPDRYATSLAVAKEVVNPKTVVLAAGTSYPDALTAAPLAAKMGAPVILVQGDTLSADLAAYLSDIRRGLEEVIIVGGENSVSLALESRVKDLMQATSRTITPNILEGWLEKEDVKVFDLRSVELFEEGHIPGAQNIGNKEFEDPDNAVDGELATPEQFEALMSRYGILPTDTIVVYSDATKPQMAPRLVWTFEAFGQTNTYVLDGHYQALVEQGKAVEKGAAEAPTATEYKIISTENTINVGKDAVINRAKDTVLVDCRPVAEYTGETVANGNARGGHIPGAVNMPYMSTVGEDGRFKDPETLRKMYAEIGVTADKEIITYCQRGHRASHTWFVLTHVLGFDNVKLYDGSMMEWSNLPELPIATGVNP